ncbi:MAG: carbohydrate binding domain-containing protein [Panacagrimonas sp.]
MPYTENFETLIASGSAAFTNNSTIPGWFHARTGTGATIVANNGSSNAGNLYSYGTGTATDRALGSLGSGNAAVGNLFWGVRLQNNTGTTITSLDVQYVGEQWRNSAAAAQTVAFSYLVGAPTVTGSLAEFQSAGTAVALLDFTSPITGGAAGAQDGNLAANRVLRTTTIVGLSIPAGTEVILRWSDPDHAGSDHGLAIDDVVVTPHGAGAASTTVSLSVTPASFSELSGSATVTATLSAVSTQDVTVNLLFGGTATNGSAMGTPDYSASAASITIPANSTSGTITLASNDDLVFEGDETIVTMLGTLTDATAGTPSMVTVTIVENEPMPPPMVGARIYQIQGATHRSPMVNMAVTGVPGIVTAVASNGLYLQDGDGDGNAATSDGIFVFTSSAPASGIAVGAQVLVDGMVDEFSPGGSVTNLTVTEIVSPTVTPFVGTGLFTNTAIAPTVLGTGGRIPPADIIDNDTAGNVETSLTTVFDPAQDGIDFYESLEGMLVQVNNGRATGPTNGFGEIWVVGDLGVNATGSNARGGVTLVERATGVDFNPERIQLDDGLNGVTSPTVNVGDTLTDIRGVVHYNFGNFEVQLTQAPSVATNPLAPSVRTLDFGGDRLTVGAYNVENLDPNDTSFARLAGQIVANIGAPDILALSEVQDNNGATNNGVVAADVTFDELIDAIVAAGGPEYSYTQIDPVNNMDGGEPGGNIRVAQLYNPLRVTFVPGTSGAGGSTDATAVAPALVGGKVALTLSPGRIDPTNSAWNFSRKPLAATYDFNGRRVVVVNNHFNSKGGDQPLFGVNQPPLLSSEVQRLMQATLVHSFVNSVLTLDANARVLVLGDLNDFDFSPPLRILRNGPLGSNGEEGTLPALVNLGAELVADAVERYGYVFEGNSQELDHILTTTSLLNAGAQFETLHINAEYADQASDHDPLVASFLLPANAAPVADAGADQTVAGGDTVTLSGTGSTDEGSIASYAWTQTAGMTVTLTGANTATASFTAPAAAGTLSFTLTVVDNEGAMDADSTNVIVGADITPADFTFFDVSGVAPGSLQTSNPVEVTGINSPAPIAVTGVGFYGIDGGPCTQTSGTVTSGAMVRVCHTASSSFSTATNTTLTIGASGVLVGESDTFASTTAAAPLPPVTNLIQNSGFETGSLAPWYFFAVGNALGNAAVDNTVKFEGNASARVTITRADAAAPWNATLGQPLSLEAGTTYTLKFRAMADRSLPIRVNLQRNVAPFTSYFSQDPRLTTGWQEFSFTFTAPVTTSALLSLNLGLSVGTLWIDAVSLTTASAPPPPPPPPPPPTAASLVLNPGFENTALAPWYFFAAGNALGSAAVDGAVKFEGNRSARVTLTRADTAAPWNATLGQGLNLTAGQTYTLKFRAMADRSRTIRAVVQRNGSPFNEFVTQFPMLDTSWREFTYTFTAPTTTAALLSFNFGQSVGNVWIDAVSLQ